MTLSRVPPSRYAYMIRSSWAPWGLRRRPYVSAESAAPFRVPSMKRHGQRVMDCESRPIARLEDTDATRGSDLFLQQRHGHRKIAVRVVRERRFATVYVAIRRMRFARPAEQLIDRGIHIKQRPSPSWPPSARMLPNLRGFLAVRSHAPSRRSRVSNVPNPCSLSSPSWPGARHCTGGDMASPTFRAGSSTPWPTSARSARHLPL